MAILTYFDASGDETHSALAIGGLLARPEQWQSFDAEWRSVAGHYWDSRPRSET